MLMRNLLSLCYVETRFTILGARKVGAVSIPEIKQLLVQ